jgi:hypothetical protein
MIGQHTRKCDLVRTQMMAPAAEQDRAVPLVLGESAARRRACRVYGMVDWHHGTSQQRHKGACIPDNATSVQVSVYTALGAHLIVKVSISILLP